MDVLDVDALLCCTRRAGHCRLPVTGHRTSVESVVEIGSEFSGGVWGNFALIFS
jgi:hypothetical protein